MYIYLFRKKNEILNLAFYGKRARIVWNHIIVIDPHLYSEKNEYLRKKDLSAFVTLIFFGS